MDVGLPYLGTGTGSIVNLTLAGEATSLPGEPDYTVVLSGEVHESNLRDVAIDYNFTTDVMEYNFVFTILNEMRNFVSTPFIATKLTALHDSIDEFTVAGDVTETGDVTMLAKVIDEPPLQDVSIVSPVTAIHESGIEELSITAGVSVLDKLYNVPVSVYSISLSIPMTLLASAEVGKDPKLTMSANVNNIDILLTSEIFDADSVRYEVADIDHGMLSGSVKLFPNDWTLCYMNKPKNDDGTDATISSSLVAMLVEKYGSDIHTKISMIVSKDPETGETYNYVIRDGYETPQGSINDFKICTLRDGAYYPVPFMVQSVSGEEISVEWDV
jgi:hypothetical protein